MTCSHAPAEGLVKGSLSPDCICNDMADLEENACDFLAPSTKLNIKKHDNSYKN